VAHKAAADGVEFGHGRPNSLSSKAALTLGLLLRFGKQISTLVQD